MTHKPEDIDRDKLPPLPDIEPLRTTIPPVPPVPQPPLPDIEPLTPSESLRTPLTRPEDVLSCRTESDE